jgi:hypothetical protein
MFYFNSSGTKIGIFNTRPRNLSGGGIIKDNVKITNKDEDTISSLLQYGSLVVPKKIVPLLDDYKGPINGPPTHNKKNLLKAIVMPGEVVVNRKYRKDVEKFLRSKGIRLPLKY